MLGKALQQEGKAVVHIAHSCRQEAESGREGMDGLYCFQLCSLNTHFLQHGSISQHPATFLSSLTSLGPSARTQSLMRKHITHPFKLSSELPGNTELTASQRRPLSLTEIIMMRVDLGTFGCHWFQFLVHRRHVIFQDVSFTHFQLSILPTCSHLFYVPVSPET